ncbi:MAG: AAA family ATPase, partial [Candidatus Sericytochromatia bacterium]|nr:AAA family ATPase [Candidatus Sericytochromatia bacterium]
KTEKVVLLIDEYDKPIVDYFNNVKKATANREVLKTFYNTIKSCDKYIHFAFLTGVSKFSKVSIFSTLNNITDITLDEKYSKIVGITEEELYANFEDRIKIFADIKNKSVEKVKKELKDWYNGFSWDGKNFLYNPYSLLLLFSKNVFDNYWFESGTPTFFVDFIKKYKIDIKDIENCVLSRDKFEFFDIEKINPYAVFFQTGYLTIKKIKEYEDYAREYTLSYPNKEVKDSILKYFLLDIVDQDVDSSIIINRIKESLRNKDLDSFFRYLISLFDSIPYQIAPKKKSKTYDKEAYYHSIFHVIFTLIGLRIDSEVSVSSGRVDSVVETDDTVYIFEFKLETNQQNAIGQIMDKKYYSKYSQSKKEIVLVGVIFDMKIKNIKGWEIVKI